MLDAGELEGGIVPEAEGGGRRRRGSGVRAEIGETAVVA